MDDSVVIADTGTYSLLSKPELNQHGGLEARKFQLKLMHLGLHLKYNCKDCLIMAPDSILKRESKIDVYALGLFLLQLVTGIDVLRVSDSDLQTVDNYVGLSESTISLLDLTLDKARFSETTVTW